MIFQASLEKVIACREHLVECMWPREHLRELVNGVEEPSSLSVTEEKGSLSSTLAFNNAEMKQQRSFERLGGENAENVCPFGGSSSPTKARKRQRRKSRCSEGSGKIKTAPDEIFIDEIYDAVHVLYGMEKFR